MAEQSSCSKTSVSDSFFDNFSEYVWKKSNNTGNQQKSPFKKKQKRSKNFTPPPLFVRSGEFENTGRNEDNSGFGKHNGCSVEPQNLFNPSFVPLPRKEWIESLNIAPVQPLQLQHIVQQTDISSVQQFIREESCGSVKRRGMVCERLLRSVSESEATNMFDALNELKLLEQKQHSSVINFDNINQRKKKIAKKNGSENKGFEEDPSVRNITSCTPKGDIKNNSSSSVKKKRRGKSEDVFEGLIKLEDVKNGLKNNSLIEAELRINPRNFKEAYITHPVYRQDVLIVGVADRNRALESDIVVVQVKEEDKWRKQQNGTVIKTGKVVYISELVHTRSLIGLIQKQDDLYALFKPRDSRLPRLLINLLTLPNDLKSNLDEFADVYFKAQIVCWNNPKFAEGLIVCKIGKKGEISGETEAILKELDLDSGPVPESYNKYLPSIPYEITQEEINSRLDLRNELIFSIDPETARDLDDAVSIKKLSHNKFEVGVHISDVTHFLSEGTPLDEIVSERATTIYMVDKVNHMLPIQLCMLCSLLPGEDKLAFSVIWEMDELGNITDTKFCRTIINSCAQLSYGHAQDIIEGKECVDLPRIHNGKTENEIKESILDLYRISKNLTNKRFAGGALRIDQPKVSFKLDSDYLPYDATLYEMKDSNRLIEEFMLLANQSVAKFIHKNYPKLALLRRHPPPKEDMIVKLESSLSKLGIFIETSTAGDLQRSLLKYTQDDPGRATVLNCLYSRAMNRALYFCFEQDTHHYALNIDKYTHFTSPIRRYADIAVHRILSATLNYTAAPDWSVVTVRKFARNSNVKKYAAKRAGEASSDLFTALYIKKLGSLETDAFVYNINSHSFDAIINSLALKVRVYIDDLNVDVKHEENDIASCLLINWKQWSYSQIVQLFTEVKLLLKTQDTSLQIEAHLCPPKLL